MKILMPLPDSDFDTTETAVPWKLLTRAGHQVVFATEEGRTPACDPLLLTGVIFGQLGAEPEPKAFYAEMAASKEFQQPRKWRDLDPAEFDALFLPGGHAPGMKQYLGSEVLQSKVAQFWMLHRPVAAICHGPVVLARSRMNGQSVLSGYRTTCLPKYMERSAYLLTAWRRGRYYRTYPAYVEDEVRAAGGAFERGPRVLTRRGTDEDDGPTFVVRDRNYVSARWPGDSYKIAKELLAMLEETKSASRAERGEVPPRGVPSGMPVDKGGSMIASDPISSERQQRKQKLAAAYRLFARFQFDEGVAGHITVRDPGEADRFWVNPLGRYFGHMRASDLVLVNHEGEILEGKGPINRAAFAIHSQVHKARPDVVAAAHAHSPAGKAFSSLHRPLAPLTQDACAFFEDHGVFEDFTGVVSQLDEGKRIADALGSKKAAILVNHGLITVGNTVDEAAWWFITMERSCAAELAARAAGEVKEIPAPVARSTRDTIGNAMVGWLSFQPLYARIVQEEPDLLE